MKNQNITFQQFLERIKTIDVGELLEKAKTIKVEDIKSIKLSDLKEITKSDYFFPSIGIIFAALTSILFLIPSIESLKEKNSKSKQFKEESNELPFLSEELMRRNESKQKFDLIYKDFKGLVANKAELILIPEILYDSSNRSGAQIIEYAPITSEDLNSCRSVSEEDFFDGFENNLNSENFEENFDMPFEDTPLDDFSSGINETKLKVKEFFINENEGNDFTELKKNIDEIFESNYFVINIRSDYLNSLTFLKYLQEYKIAILPYCFEPKMRSNNSNNMEENQSSAIGEIDARIIINVPIYK
jgi:hypothetical protein